jgi:SAM-dependent methyltransferase
MECNKVSKETPLRILDLCTGTGCITLLLHALLAASFESMTILGVDASSRAIRLAQKNMVHNLQRGYLSDRAKKEVIFRQADVLDSGVGGIPPLKDILGSQASRDVNKGDSEASWDVLISNPPYISPSCMVDGTTARSVRVYEPRRALVPPLIGSLDLSTLGVGHVRPEDIFYPRLLCLAFRLGVRLAVFECGDLAQAQRVVDMANILARQLQHGGEIVISIWKEGLADEAGISGARAVIIERC